MKFFITKKKLIKELAKELAYLQIRADWWFYVCPANNEETKERNHDMASSQLELVTEVREISNRLGIIKEVYDEAYRIYNFRNSGRSDYNPDIELIRRLDSEFCEPRKKKRIVW